jgi:hypothetical protein
VRERAAATPAAACGGRCKAPALKPIERIPKIPPVKIKLAKISLVKINLSK